LAAVLIPFFVAGGWLNPWNNGPVGLASIRVAALPTNPAGPRFEMFDNYRMPKLDVSTDGPAPAVFREREPRALADRAESMRRTAAAITAECEQAAGGDWEKWQQDTAGYRAQLGDRVAALTDVSRAATWKNSPMNEVLASLDDFPLFEIDAKKLINHLFEDDALDQFRCERPVVAADRWLRQRGIDLIFVPIPKMSEIYIEHFVNPSPTDGIIAPYVRLAQLELLQADVEVVDGWQLFRPQRYAESEYLYNTADHHWAPRGMRIMAKEIADRIERYKFGARARYASPIVQASPGPYLFRDRTGTVGGYGKTLLNAEQLKLASAAQTTTQAAVLTQNGEVPPDDPNSPVIVMGHSFIPRFREQLIKELNLLTHTRAFDHQTTESFADFVREPELLEHCRVLVWISTTQHMTRFKDLPPQVLAALPND
jgi:hypothetical protein